MEPTDSSYMPSLVAVLTGDTIGNLKEVRQVSISSSSRECVLLSGLTEVRLHVKEVRLRVNEVKLHVNEVRLRVTTCECDEVACVVARIQLQAMIAES